MSLRKCALAILLISAVVIPALGQGPLRKRVNFTITESYTLKNSDVVLPPGKYVLYQVSEAVPDLFALYRDNTGHSPIAVINTVRRDYSANRFPGKTRLLTEIDESSSGATRVLEGWNIPGEDGWQAISSVTRHRTAVQTR